MSIMTNMPNILTPYPLYDYLVSKVESRAVTAAGGKVIDINRVCSTITNIERIVDDKDIAAEHYKEINWLIIRHYHITTGIETALPYDVKLMVGGKGILASMNNLPVMLQQILAQYIEEETGGS